MVAPSPRPYSRAGALTIFHVPGQITIDDTDHAPTLVQTVFDGLPHLVVVRVPISLSLFRRWRLQGRNLSWEHYSCQFGESSRVTLVACGPL